MSFEVLELLNRKGLCETICYLISGRNEPDIQHLVGHPFPDKVEVHLNVFGSCMKHRISRKVCRTKVIAPKTWNLGLRYTNFSKN